MLFLGGNSSRNGSEGMELALKYNIELIILPANTTHLLQLCVNGINNTFQGAIRDTRDTLLKMKSTNVH